MMWPTGLIEEPNGSNRQGGFLMKRKKHKSEHFIKKLPEPVPLL